MSARYTPRLALVDITLDGEIEGISLARRLKNEMSIASVFVTAQPTLARGNADAALGLIEKPYLPEGVSRAIAAIDEVLDGGASHCRASALEWFGASRPPPRLGQLAEAKARPSSSCSQSHVASDDKRGRLTSGISTLTSSR